MLSVSVKSNLTSLVKDVLNHCLSLHCRNHQLVETCQQYKSVITLRRGITSWICNTTELVDVVERAVKGKMNKTQLAAKMRNLERAASELDHTEEKLTELNRNCGALVTVLEVSFTDKLGVNVDRDNPPHHHYRHLR